MTSEKGRARRHTPRPRAKKVEPVKPPRTAVDSIKPYVMKRREDGMPWEVHDPRNNVNLMVVKAGTVRRCCLGDVCLQTAGGFIHVDDIYIKVIDLARPGRTSSLGGYHIPDAEDYHTECVPNKHNDALILFLPDEEQVKVRAEMKAREKRRAGKGQLIYDLSDVDHEGYQDDLL